jgi:hypothetical protein
MNDLDQRIRAWRETLARDLVRPDVLDELETHLREEIQRLLVAGEPMGRAFATAVARLGDTGELAAEFAKVPPTAAWWPARVVLGLAAAWAMLVVALAVGVGREPLLTTHVAAVTLGYTGALFAGMLAGCYLVARPFGRIAPGQRPAFHRAAVVLAAAATALTGAGVLLGGVWAQQSWGRFWGWDPKETAGLVIFAWNAVLLALLVGRYGNERLHAALAVIGNVVVLLGWFGTNFLTAAGLHSYGFPPAIGILLAIAVALHGLLLAFALVPDGRFRKAPAQ